MCSGQSNMELNMHFTFEKNDTYAAVAADRYTNIRLFHLAHNPVPYSEMAWLINSSVVTTNWTVADHHIVDTGGKGEQCPDQGKSNRPQCTAIDQFSAACWYFAQALTDRMVAEAEATGSSTDPVPLGMIESAYGGTTIEQWVSLEEQVQPGTCSNITCLANKSAPVTPATAKACTENAEEGNGGLWRGMTAPFINMTLRGWLWYQGENNLFADAGNVVGKTGYACMLQTQMQSWRSAWSVVPDTTPHDAPFGIVTLADATDEGWGCNMEQMHWAETGNYGVVPNPALQNAFVAAAHDLGEPWDDGCKGSPHFCCVCANQTRDPACAVGVDSKFDPITKFPWIIQHGSYKCSIPSTPQLMGGVHPSTKKHVGDRLAQAAWSLHYDHPEVPFTGPVISACGIEKRPDGKDQIRLVFNASLLAGDTVRVSNYNKGEQASATFVRVGTPFPDDAWQNLVYKNRAAWWGDDATWIQVNIASATEQANAGVTATAVLVDLSNVPAGRVITGIKYGQGIPGMIPQSGHKRVCCGTRDVSVNPCPPASCPISSASGSLPAMPFLAAITPSGQCRGLNPQVITGLI